MQFKVLRDTIESERLIEKVGKISGYLRTQVENSTKSSSKITNVAGEGLNLYINTKDGQAAKSLQHHLIKNGVISRLNGEHGITLKPALIVQEKHVDQVAKALSSFQWFQQWSLLFNYLNILHIT